MTAALEPVQEFLAERLGDDALAASVDRGEATVLIAPSRVVDALAAVKAAPWDFAVLIDLTAWDRHPIEPRLEVVYNLLSWSRRQRLRVRARVDSRDAVLPTATGVYAAADWFERELWDLFGIRFDGHPNLTRILMPDDWEGHPLRRDFALGDEPVEFQGHIPKRPSDIIPHVPARRKDR